MLKNMMLSLQVCTLAYLWKIVQACLGRACFSNIRAATQLNQQNDLCAQRRLRSAQIRPVWSEPLLCAQWVAEDPMFLQGTVKTLGSDWMDAQADLSLCWAQKVILLLLSCGGSFIPEDMEKYLYSQIYCSWQVSTKIWEIQKPMYLP